MNSLGLKRHNSSNKQLLDAKQFKHFDNDALYRGPFNFLWPVPTIKKYMLYKSGFCHHFSGQEVQDGISEQDWCYKYNFITEKYQEARSVQL